MKLQDWVLFAIGIILSITSLAMGVVCALNELYFCVRVSFLAGGLYAYLAIGFYKDIKRINNDK